MITLFSIPKAFRGHIGIIQRNAIASWVQLRPHVEIMLFGDDEGTATAAGEMGVQHHRQCARNEYGTPLLNDIFERAKSLGTRENLCYVNADIILMGDFIHAVARLAGRERRFMMVGQRWDIDVVERVEFGSGWEEKLRARVAGEGKLHPSTGIDYFLFPRGMLEGIPPFAIGRTAFDNWLIFRARSMGVRVVDATRVVTAVHQNHDFLHYPGGASAIIEGAEGRRNRELAGGPRCFFTLEDATHMLTPSGLRLALSKSKLRRRVITVPVLHPRLEPLIHFARVMRKLARRTAQLAIAGYSFRR